MQEIFKTGVDIFFGLELYLCVIHNVRVFHCFNYKLFFQHFMKRQR